MSIVKWIGTPWFWVPFLVCNLLLLWLFIKEERHLKNGTRCSTCGSTKKKIKGKVRYFLTNYIYYDSICNDDWHRN